MIYLTGDIHAYNYNNFYNLIERVHFKKDDVFIIAGDFGLPWSKADTLDDEQEKTMLQTLAARSFTTCFIDGNHENFDRLDTYPYEHKWGGQVQNVEGIYHLCRGEIYEIEGQRIFTFGGAKSPGIVYRTKGINWWPREDATLAEETHARRNLDEYHWQVDYVITHQAPHIFWDLYHHQIFHKGLHCPTQDILDRLAKKIHYKKWYFGHYHDDVNGKRGRLLYNDIIAIGE